MPSPDETSLLRRALRGGIDWHEDRREAVARFGADPRPARFVAAPGFQWVGRQGLAEVTALPPPARHETRHARVEVLKDSHKARATEHLARIPEPGTALHLITNGTFDFWDYVRSVLALAAPRVAADFYASTWIMNRRNAADLLTLLDEGRIRRCGIITGIYFKRREAAVFHTIYEGLRVRGQRYAAALNHSKWFAMRLDDGTSLVAEGSANFSENGNAEQVVITNDPGLFDYYAAWADEILGRGELPAIDAPKNREKLPDFEDRPPADKPRPRQRPAALTRGKTVGLFVATRDPDDRETVLRWKRHRPLCPRWGAHFGQAVARTVATMFPTLPPGTIVTTPPQGATMGETYAAGILADAVASQLRTGPPVATLERTDRKTLKGWRYTIRQRPFRLKTDTRPPLAIVIDDIATTGTTLRLAVEAFRKEGIPALGFAYA